MFSSYAVHFKSLPQNGENCSRLFYCKEDQIAGLVYCAEYLSGLYRYSIEGWENVTEKSDLLYKRFLDAECQFLLGVREKKAKTNMFGIVEIGGALTELLYYAGAQKHPLFSEGQSTNISRLLAGKNAAEVLDVYVAIWDILTNSTTWQRTADGYVGCNASHILLHVQSKIDFYRNIVNEYEASKEAYLCSK